MGAGLVARRERARPHPHAAPRRLGLAPADAAALRPTRRRFGPHQQGFDAAVSRGSDGLREPDSTAQHPTRVPRAHGTMHLRARRRLWGPKPRSGHHLLPVGRNTGFECDTRTGKRPLDLELRYRRGLGCDTANRGRVLGTVQRGNGWGGEECACGSRCSTVRPPGVGRSNVTNP